MKEILYNLSWICNISKNKRESERIIKQIRSILSLLPNTDQFAREVAVCKLIIGALIIRIDENKNKEEFLELMESIISQYL